MVAHEAEATWVGRSTDGLTSLPAGAYSVTLNRLSANAATGVTITIGVCHDGTFTPLGSTTTGNIWTNAPQSQTVDVSVNSSTLLSSTTVIAIRIHNDGGNANKDFELATDGSSYLTAPSTLQP